MDGCDLFGRELFFFFLIPFLLEKRLEVERRIMRPEGNTKIVYTSFDSLWEAIRETELSEYEKQWEQSCGYIGVGESKKNIDLPKIEKFIFDQKAANKKDINDTLSLLNKTNPQATIEIANAYFRNAISDSIGINRKGPEFTQGFNFVEAVIGKTNLINLILFSTTCNAFPSSLTVNTFATFQLIESVVRQE